MNFLFLNLGFLEQSTASEIQLTDIDWSHPMILTIIVTIVIIGIVAVVAMTRSSRNNGIMRSHSFSSFPIYKPTVFEKKKDYNRPPRFFTTNLRDR